MEDYTQLAELYNQVLAKSKEMDAQILELQDGIEQLQEVIQDDKKTHEKQAAVIEYLQQQARKGTPNS